MSTDKINNVIIADSQFLVVESLKSLIESDGRYILAGVAETQSDLYKILETVQCGLLITDLANIDYYGIDDLKNIRQEYPQILILILTNSISKTEFSEFSRLGIKNIIYKNADKEEIFSAIKSTLKRRKFYSDEILDLLLDPIRSEERRVGKE